MRRNAIFEHLKEYQLGEHVLLRQVQQLPQAVRGGSEGGEPPDLSEQRVCTLERKRLIDGVGEGERKIGFRAKNLLQPG